MSVYNVKALLKVAAFVGLHGIVLWKESETSPKQSDSEKPLQWIDHLCLQNKKAVASCCGTPRCSGPSITDKAGTAKHRGTSAAVYRVTFIFQHNNQRICGDLLQLWHLLINVKNSSAVIRCCKTIKHKPRHLQAFFDKSTVTGCVYVF